MRFLLAVVQAFLCLLPWHAEAQDKYPSRPIRFVFPYPAGGSADALCRAFAEELRERLGQPVIVENRPGANTLIGAEMVARAPADGYTLLWLGWPTLTTNFVTYRKIPFKLEDFQPLTPVFRSAIGLTVKNDLPVANLRELIDYTKKQGRLTYGTAGAGSSPHLMMERLKKLTGAQFEHVPYKGEAPPVADVVGGHLPMFAGSLATPAPHFRAGRLKVISVTSAERMPGFEQVPTFREEGFGEHVFTFWHGVALPAGTPRPIVDRLHGAFVAAMAAERVRKVFSPDWLPTALSPEEFGALIRRDIETWGPVIREANLVTD